MEPCRWSVPGVVSHKEGMMASAQDDLARRIRERTNNGLLMFEFFRRHVEGEPYKYKAVNPRSMGKGRKLPKPSYDIVDMTYYPTARDRREALAGLVRLAAGGCVEARRYLEANYGADFSATD
jgi:hypothetical protein